MVGGNFSQMRNRFAIIFICDCHKGEGYLFCMYWGIFCGLAVSGPFFAVLRFQQNCCGVRFWPHLCAVLRYEDILNAVLRYEDILNAVYFLSIKTE